MDFLGDGGPVVSPPGKNGYGFSDILSHHHQAAFPVKLTETAFRIAVDGARVERPDPEHQPFGVEPLPGVILQEGQQPLPHAPASEFRDDLQEPGHGRLRLVRPIQGRMTDKVLTFEYKERNDAPPGIEDFPPLAVIERVMGLGPDKPEVLGVLDHPFQQGSVDRVVFDNHHGSFLLGLVAARTNPIIGFLVSVEAKRLNYSKKRTFRQFCPIQSRQLQQELAASSIVVESAGITRIIGDAKQLGPAKTVPRAALIFQGGFCR